MHWMLMPLRRYAEFGGRSRRREYWLYTLGYLIVGAILMTLWLTTAAGVPFDPDTGEPAAATVPWLGALGLLGLALFVPTLAVQVRRFHDQDRSGWFVLMGFIPYVGGLIVLVFMCLPGTVGPNRFGPDPKGRTGDLDVFA